jgi:3-isopropylmalate/(R)-2-methylmalate dehydratase small subunit
VEPFTVHNGTVAVLAQDDVDTDRIIPARFLSRISREGYGELLFRDVRGQAFPLDEPAARGASVLVVGTNFGCGSSREHAVWAIQQAGFKAVISHAPEPNEGYSDIFRQNAANCGLLLIELPTAKWMAVADAGNGVEISIDLPRQQISLGDSQIDFEINPSTKKAILSGLDLVGTTLQYESDISSFEKTSGLFVPPRED